MLLRYSTKVVAFPQENARLKQQQAEAEARSTAAERSRQAEERKQVSRPCTLAFGQCMYRCCRHDVSCLALCSTHT